MKIVLATGIYPPQIGGPATYAHALAQDLSRRGIDVAVVTYERIKNQESRIMNETSCPVIRVSMQGGPIVRWCRFAQTLRTHARGADIIYAFSSVSVGVPLWIAHVKNPRKVLRLGGDFLWERYADHGGSLTLKDWYASRPLFKSVMNGILRTFDYIVFSTHFQEELFERFYTGLPQHGVIENALPAGTPQLHRKHNPFRLLSLGRYVPFKNLGSLLMALPDLPGMTLTFVGSGPLEKTLKRLTAQLHLEHRVTFLPPAEGAEKQRIFLEHDLLVLPSYTELSPNAALEARSSGLPVLLTEETGLSHTLSDAAQLRKLESPQDITHAIMEVESGYESIAERSARTLPERGWQKVGDETVALFRSLL